MDIKEEDIVRMDKWLWAARLFKTRSLAADAIKGGKNYIAVNGSRSEAVKRTIERFQFGILSPDYIVNKLARLL